MVEFVTKAGLAAHLGVAPSRISALVKRGLPVRPDRKINLEQALGWISKNVAQQAGFQDRGIHRVLAAGKPAGARVAASGTGTPPELPKGGAAPY